MSKVAIVYTYKMQQLKQNVFSLQPILLLKVNQWFLHAFEKQGQLSIHFYANESSIENQTLGIERFSDYPIINGKGASQHNKCLGFPRMHSLVDSLICGQIRNTC